MSRQTLYTPELAEALIDWIASGQTLRAFCRQDGYPAWRTVYDWIEADEALAARIAHARDLGADAIAEEALQIADTTQEGVTLTTDEKGTKEVRGDMLGHRKLQIETRLKLLAKWNPKKYGDKVETTHVGDRERPIVVSQADVDL